MRSLSFSGSSGRHGIVQAFGVPVPSCSVGVSRKELVPGDNEPVVILTEGQHADLGRCQTCVLWLLHCVVFSSCFRQYHRVFTYVTSSKTRLCCAPNPSLSNPVGGSTIQRAVNYTRTTNTRSSDPRLDSATNLHAAKSLGQKGSNDSLCAP